MNIYLLLKTKPHNEHYLNRYFNFINRCIIRNSLTEIAYFEKHHILPKSKDMFPEFASLKKHPWNCAVLTFRQHLLAHYMLMKAYNVQSQTLSFIRTSGQYHAKTIKGVNTKFLAVAKEKLSLARKGIFTRGYNVDGTPNVSQTTKHKLSEQKKLFYSLEENRKKQSIACKGKKKTNTDNIKLAAQNRSKEHRNNLSQAISKAWELKRLNKTTKRIKDGVYVTPIGIFTSIPEYRSYCRNSEKPFTIHSIKKNPKLNHSVIGLTPRQLGFFFIDKSNPAISQYYDDLNQAHLPEPNHLLSSELDDYLSREKLLLRT